MLLATPPNEKNFLSSRRPNSRRPAFRSVCCRFFFRFSVFDFGHRGVSVLIEMRTTPPAARRLRKANLLAPKKTTDKVHSKNFVFFFFLTRSRPWLLPGRVHLENPPIFIDGFFSNQKPIFPGSHDTRDTCTTSPEIFGAHNFKGSAYSRLCQQNVKVSLCAPSPDR